MSLQKGLVAEQQVKQYLSEQGLLWLASNYRCRVGEIDLIMNDHQHLVFVEVRARSSKAFGSALETVTYAKQQKIIKAALHFMLVHKQYNHWPARFDVVSLQGELKQI